MDDRSKKLYETIRRLKNSPIKQDKDTAFKCELILSDEGYKGGYDNRIVEVERLIDENNKSDYERD